MGIKKVLTNQRKRFCNNLVFDDVFNYQAYAKAFPRQAKYNKFKKIINRNVLCVKANELLKIQEVKDYIAGLEEAKLATRLFTYEEHLKLLTDKIRDPRVFNKDLLGLSKAIVDLQKTTQPQGPGLVINNSSNHRRVVYCKPKDKDADS